MPSLSVGVSLFGARSMSTKVSTPSCRAPGTAGGVMLGIPRGPRCTLHHILPGFFVLRHRRRNVEKTRPHFGPAGPGGRRRRPVAGARRNVWPAFEPEGCHGSRDLRRGIDEGRAVCAEHRADGKLAGRAQVEERDPRQVDKNRSPARRDVVQGTLQPSDTEHVELSPQLDQQSRSGLAHFDPVQFLSLPLVRYEEVKISSYRAFQPVSMSASTQR